MISCLKWYDIIVDTFPRRYELSLKSMISCNDIMFFAHHVMISCNDIILSTFPRRFKTMKSSMKSYKNDVLYHNCLKSCREIIDEVSFRIIIA